MHGVLVRSPGGDTTGPPGPHTFARQIIVLTAMNLRSLPTRLFLLCSILIAFAFGEDGNSISFSLSSERIFSPGDKDISVEMSGYGIGGATMAFRAFRIHDPVTFFMAQKDPHYPSFSNLTGPNTFDMIGQGFNKVKRDARYAARDVMPADARRAIRDVADLNGTEGKKPEPEKRKEPAAQKDIPSGAEDYEIVREWKHTMGKEADDVEDEADEWHYETIPVPITDKGVYLIEGKLLGRRSVTALVISEYGVIIKQADTQALAFVVNKKSGEKVADVPIMFTRGGEKVAEGTTGADGVVQVSLPALPPYPEYDEEIDIDWYWEQSRRQLYVFAEKDGNFLISDPYGGYGGYGERSYRIYNQTDRPVYRPAQTVYYRGIIRRENQDGSYSLVTDSAVYVEIEDGRDALVRRDTLRLSDMGTFNGELLLGEDAPLGYYSISVSIDGQRQWFNFSVEEYKKPEYKVTVRTDRELYTRGDVIHAKVQADYFFGSPVANADVEYFIYRARYHRPWWRNSEWAYLYEDDNDFYTYRMEMVESDTGSLAPDGSFSITYRTGSREDEEADRDYVYRIQANIVDNSRRSISGSKSVEVTRGEFYISTRTDKYVYRPGDEAKVDVEIMKFDGDRPVATRFDATVRRIWWDRYVRDTIDGVPSYRYERKSAVIWNGSGSTGEDGKGKISYRPDSIGYLEMTLEARDARGTRITEVVNIYVANNSYARWDREGTEVQIIPDKDSYSPGETMSALVIMPASEMDALITAEGATLFSYQIERLTSNSAIINVPIRENYAPVFYIGVSVIVNDALYTESQRVTVVPKGKLIRLEVTADKQTYRPGENGTVAIRAVDETGSPVGNVDVAVGMVDEAIYSIRPDATPNIQRFFYGNRWNSVATSSSLDFYFYGQDQVTRQRYADPLYGSVGAGAGDRGRHNIAYGDVKGQMFVQPTTRRKFKDLMFWTPSVRTGSDGRATVNVEFPDNLTTWRITARGVTANTAVGEAVARVVSRKELIVRMETPRFMIQGDELHIATTVHNYLSSAKTAKVEFTGENVTVSERERSITIPANGEQRIDWKIVAPATGGAKLTVKALTNEESDAMELTVPVLPRGIRASTGELVELSAPNETRTLSLTLPAGSDPTTAEAFVSLSPSLAASLMGSLDQLIGYPYGCVEQTMSRFLPTLAVEDALRQLNVPFDEKKRAEIPKMVNKGLARLYAMQNEAGGWGWWSGDASDPYMTAYVMYGLTVARRVGYQVIPERYDQGARELRRIIDNYESDRKTLHAGRQEHQKDNIRSWTDRAYALFALSAVEQGARSRPLIDRISELARIDSLNSYSLALLTLAANGQGESRLAASLAARLESRAKISSEGASWSSIARRFYWAYDDVESSAFAVRALYETRGETDLVKKGIRWLLSRREADGWHNTRQTSTVILSLVGYLKNSRELDADYTMSVKVNGRPLLERRVTRADIFKKEESIRLEGAALRAGANTVTIEKSGVGHLYSAARLSYFATRNIKAANAGFQVSREYFRLRKTRRNGGEYIYTKLPFTGTVTTGEELFVKVKVVPSAAYEYFMLEDPLPAGCEVVATTDGYIIADEPSYIRGNISNVRFTVGSGSRAGGAPVDHEIRDEKVVAFLDYAPPREFTITYIIRAQIPGSYAMLPSIASLMYYPEVRGNGPLGTMKITE